MTSSMLAYTAIVFIISKIIDRIGIRLKIWIPAFLFLSFTALASFFVSYASSKMIPASFIVKGNSIPSLPIAAGAVVSAFAAVTFCNRKKPDIVQKQNENNIIAWCLCVLGLILFIVSYYAVILSIFLPDVFYSESPVPKIGVCIYVVLSVPVSIILYYLARFTYNNTDKQNYFRWLSLFVGFYCILITTLLSLMLICSTQVTPEIAYPFYANIMTIAYFPFSLLIFGLVSGNIKRSADV